MLLSYMLVQNMYHSPHYTDFIYFEIISWFLGMVNIFALKLKRDWNVLFK